VDYIDIKNGDKVFPGEYLFHKPSKDIVVCGSYDPQNDVLKALYRGRLIKDGIKNFQKIKLSSQEKRQKTIKRKCGGCKKR
tara:strand:- start:39 stop:281 length:243 start_codon:yes stop_codon:yes gene_type:complete